MASGYIGMLLLVTGVLTASAGVGLFAPRPLLGVLLGTERGDAAMLLLARHWSLLISLVGGLLIYAAYHPDVRVPVMVVAAAEKLVLAVLVAMSPLRRRMETVSVVGADVVMASLYVVYLAQRGFS